MKKLLETLSNGGWVGFIVRYGVGSFIAIWLVWWMTGIANIKHDEILKGTNTVMTAMTSAEKDMSNFKNQQTEFNKDFIILMRQICVNTANTELQKDNCLK